MDSIFKKSIKKAQSYLEYKSMILDLIKEGKSTGANQNDDLFNFTRLNDKRMKRLDKKTRLSEFSKEEIQKIEKDYIWLVLTESWCGDAAHVLPVLNKFSEVNPKIDLKVVLRDDNEDLMNQFLTNGSKSIPKLIVIDNNANKVIDSWGPRSKVATKMVMDYKEKHGKIDAEFKKDLQIWYNKDKGVNIEKDIVELIENMK
ncbi:MAG: thioredoxin family protein [Flavobacteriaceae bacterium]|nr:thioredoxin family protein [Flavobacteriaceae bacterium]